MTAPDRSVPVVTVNVRRLARRRTGIERYMDRLIGALHATGLARVLATTCEALPSGSLPGAEILLYHMNGLRAGRLGSQIRKLWFDAWGCLEPVRGRGPVLFHGMDGLAPRSLRRSDRCVVTIHDLAFAVHPELYDRRTRLLYRAVLPWTVRRADRIIADSMQTADDLVRLTDTPASRIDVVHLGVDARYFHPPGPEVPPGPWDGSPYVLAVGGISPRKNGRRVLEAFARWRARDKRHRDWRLLVAGQSLDPEFAGALPVVPEGVMLLGHVDDRALHVLYARARALLFPALYEGFGLPILEAMALGTPVVTSVTGSAPEAAGDAAVLVDPLDVDAIVAGLERATDPDECRRLRSQGPARARKFTWERTAALTAEVYRALGG